MSTLTVAGRLEALKRSLEAAQIVKKPTVPVGIRPQHDLYMLGLNDGLQLAIDAVARELNTIDAGLLAANQ